MYQYKIIEHILKNLTTIAVVGFSTKPDKPGYFVPKYLKKHGYRIVPINPYVETGLGQEAYPSLFSIPFDIDVVQIFRQSDLVVPHVKEAIEIGAKAVWLQRDIANLEAKQMAHEAEIYYIENRCMMIEHRHLRQYGWGGLSPEKRHG